MEKEQIEQLKKLGIIFNTDKVITEDEVKQVLEAVLKIFDTFYAKTTKLNTETRQEGKDLHEKIKKEGKALLDKLTDDNTKSETKKKTDLAEAISEVKRIANKVMLMKPKDGLPGAPGENAEADTAEELRDKLQSLRKGDRLTIDAVEELAEIIEDIYEELKKVQRGVTTGEAPRAIFGGGRVRFVDDFTPIGTINDVNAVFTLAKTPATGSLKVYRNGTRQRVTEDYTFDGFRTITFITPPQVGEILLVDFRY